MTLSDLLGRSTPASQWVLWVQSTPRYLWGRWFLWPLLGQSIQWPPLVPCPPADLWLLWNQLDPWNPGPPLVRWRPQHR